MRLASVAAATVVACAAFASFSASANDVEVSVDARAYVGEKPKVHLKVKKDVATATIDVRAAGASLKQSRGPADAGSEIVFELPHGKVGQLNWKGTLSIAFTDGSTGEMPLAFTTDVSGKITFDLLSDKNEILTKNQVRVKMSRPAGAVDVTVIGDDGDVLANTSQKFNGEAPGTELVAAWIPKKDTKPLCISVVVHDTTGFFSPTLEFCPWDLEIPHEDVLFETGKADIRASEAPKLEKAYAELTRLMERYARALKYAKVKPKLFIAGHTDTVGSAATNRTLSDARAQSIAKWFAAKKLPYPIYARGFGEDMPAVDTPDETDEPRNRRALYTLSMEDPAGGLKGWSAVH